MVHTALQTDLRKRGVPLGLSENEGTKATMYVRVLILVEQAGVEAGLRSSNAFTLRRSQILLASSRGQRPKAIALNLGCVTQTVRNAIHAFHQKGLDCLKLDLSREPLPDWPALTLPGA